MLSKIIKNIRAKPESARKGITLAVSLGITSVIGFFWFVSYINYSSAMLSTKVADERSPSTFLNKMGSLIGESYANVRSKIGVSENASSSSSTATATASESSATSTTPADAEQKTAEPDAGLDAKPDAKPDSDSVDLQDILNTKKQDNQ